MTARAETRRSAPRASARVDALRRGDGRARRFERRATATRTTPRTRAEASASREASMDDASASESLIQVGAIVGAHSLRGEVRVKPMTDFIEERLMRTGSTLRVELEAQGKSTKSGEFDAPPGEVRAVKVRSGRWVTSKGRNDVIVKLAGCDDRNAAEALVGTRLFVLPSDREPLRKDEGAEGSDGDDEFYAQELEGLRVVERDTGEVIGVVEDVVRGAGTQDLLKVAFIALDEETGIDAEYYVYVPFVKEIVPLVDATNGFMEITPPGGLLDLKIPKKTKKQRARVAAKQKEKRDAAAEASADA